MAKKKIETEILDPDVVDAISDDEGVKWYTITEAAETFRISKDRIYRAMKFGGLPFKENENHKKTVTEADLEDYFSTFQDIRTRTGDIVEPNEVGKFMIIRGQRQLISELQRTNSQLERIMEKQHEYVVSLLKSIEMLSETRKEGSD